jgi:CelD/BcsL family acetyltransferase involved in cellulose biosynthesis
MSALRLLFDEAPSDRAALTPLKRPAAVTIVDPCADSSWDNEVASHPDATVFHSAAWARVLAHSYGHRPFYLRIAAGSEIIGLIPLMELRSVITGRRGISLPFSDYCRPLFFQDVDHPFVVQKIRQIARERRWKYFEFRGDSLAPENVPVSETFYGHELNLRPGASALHSLFAESVRRALRKAERSGVTCSVQTGSAALAAFYRLHTRTRRRHGLPPQPWRFFASIQRYLFEPGQGFVVSAKSGERPIAAAVFLQFRDNAIYKFGASDERCQGLRANNLVMWEGIKSLLERGMNLLHFGRTSCDNPGLRRFKSSWGSQESIIPYFRFNTRTGAWEVPSAPGRALHQQIFRHLPLKINNVAGAMLYPHLH